MSIVTTSEKGVKASVGNASDNLSHLIRNAVAYRLPVEAMQRLVALAEQDTWDLASDVQWLHATRASVDSAYGAAARERAAEAEKAAELSHISLRAAYIDLMLDEALASLARFEDD